MADIFQPVASGLGSGAVSANPVQMPNLLAPAADVFTGMAGARSRADAAANEAVGGAFVQAAASTMLAEERAREQENILLQQSFSAGATLFDDQISEADSKFIREHELTAQALATLNPIQRKMRANTAFTRLVEDPRFPTISSAAQSKVLELYGKTQEASVDPVSAEVTKRAGMFGNPYDPGNQRKALEQMSFEADYEFKMKVGVKSAGEAASLAAARATADTQTLFLVLSNERQRSGFIDQTAALNTLQQSRSAAIQKYVSDARAGGGIVTQDVLNAGVDQINQMYDSVEKLVASGSFTAMSESANKAVQNAVRLKFPAVAQVFEHADVTGGQSLAVWNLAAETTNPTRFKELFGYELSEQNRQLVLNQINGYVTSAANGFSDILPAGSPEAALLRTISSSILTTPTAVPEVKRSSGVTFVNSVIGEDIPKLERAMAGTDMQAAAQYAPAEVRGAVNGRATAFFRDMGAKVTGQTLTGRPGYITPDGNVFTFRYYKDATGRPSNVLSATAAKEMGLTPVFEVDAQATNEVKSVRKILSMPHIQSTGVDPFEAFLRDIPSTREEALVFLGQQ